MQESQLVGLLAIGAGIFAIAAAGLDADWFMNSRKAKAWVKRIGRTNARWMYGSIGGFVCLFGLWMVITAPGDQTPTGESTASSSDSDAAQPAPSPAPAADTTQPNPYAPTSAPNPYAPNPATDFQPQSTPQTQSSVSSQTTTANQPASSNWPPPAVTSTQQNNTAPTNTTPSTANAQTGTAPAPQPGSTIDLLALIDPARDQLHGNWKFDNGQLVSPYKKPAVLLIPIEPPTGSYTVRAVVEEIEGHESFSLGLVVGGHGVTAVVAGTVGPQSGLNLVNNQIDRRKHTIVSGPVMTSGRNTIIGRVEPGHLVVECNGQPVIEWQGDPKELAYGFEWKAGGPDRLKVGSWANSCRISELTLQTATNTGG